MGAAVTSAADRDGWRNPLVFFSSIKTANENQSFHFRENLSKNFATRHQKTNNASSVFLMNKIICSILTLQVANIGIDITCISTSFKFSNNCNF